MEVVFRTKKSHTCMSLSLSKPSLMLSMNFPNNPFGFCFLSVERHCTCCWFENERKNGMMRTTVDNFTITSIKISHTLGGTALFTAPSVGDSPNI